MRFARGDVRDHIVHRKTITAKEGCCRRDSPESFLRDFQRRPIFDFCNSIGQFPTPHSSQLSAWLLWAAENFDETLCDRSMNIERRAVCFGFQKSETEPWLAHKLICSPVRTAIGAYEGSLKDTPVADLGAALAIRSTLETVQ